MRDLQVSDIPDDVVERLEQIAARRNLSVNDLVLESLARLARRRTNAEIFESLPDVGVSTDATLSALDEGRAGR